MALLKTYLRIVVFAALSALLFSCGEKDETLPAYTPKQRTGEPYFQQRGLVLAWDDVKIAEICIELLADEARRTKMATAYSTE